MISLKSPTFIYNHFALLGNQPPIRVSHFQGCVSFACLRWVCQWGFVNLVRALQVRACEFRGSITKHITLSREPWDHFVKKTRSLRWLSCGRSGSKLRVGGGERWSKHPSYRLMLFCLEFLLPHLLNIFHPVTSHSLSALGSWVRE